ncbi:MAG: hypothetical protein ACW986_15695 [Promethearchaeota archaeon]
MVENHNTFSYLQIVRIEVTWVILGFGFLLALGFIIAKDAWGKQIFFCKFFSASTSYIGKKFA